MKDKILVEYGWFWKAIWYRFKWENITYHISDDSKILKIKRPSRIWPTYFKTEKWYYKNLTLISKVEFDNIDDNN